jgi:hypothetical protein
MKRTASGIPSGTSSSFSTSPSSIVVTQDAHEVISSLNSSSNSVLLPPNQRVLKISSSSTSQVITHPGREIVTEKEGIRSLHVRIMFFLFFSYFLYSLILPSLLLCHCLMTPPLKIEQRLKPFYHTSKMRTRRRGLRH